jgi:alpha-glucosidase
MHHETSSAPRTYEQQLDTAYRLMERLGIHALKSGYVGNILPAGEHHHGQWMVRHYQKTVEAAARHKIAINIHEPIKDTGLRRTWPNLISREGLRGQEFNAWSSDGGNPPEHLSIVPFTRMLAGPIDFTPGIFHLSLKPYKPRNQVNTTLAQQLATYVVIYSPIQMAADLPEHYEGQPAFQFIRDVPCDWSESICLNGEIGEYITMARRERGKPNWFLGSINGRTPRTLKIRLDFLEKGKVYAAKIYKDAPGIAFNQKPEQIIIEEKELKQGDELELKLAAGGGAALSIIQK